MVLQVGSDAGQVVFHFNASTLQHRCRADARELQNLRRTDAARAQNDLLCGLDADHLPPCPDLCPCATLLAIGLSFNQELAHLG